jgi:hypothetical protein
MEGKKGGGKGKGNEEGKGRKIRRLGKRREMATFYQKRFRSSRLKKGRKMRRPGKWQERATFYQRR